MSNSSQVVDIIHALVRKVAVPGEKMIGMTRVIEASRDVEELKKTHYISIGNEARGAIKFYRDTYSILCEKNTTIEEYFAQNGSEKIDAIISRMIQLDIDFESLDLKKNALMPMRPELPKSITSSDAIPVRSIEEKYKHVRFGEHTEAIKDRFVEYSMRHKDEKSKPNLDELLINQKPLEYQVIVSKIPKNIGARNMIDKAMIDNVNKELAIAKNMATNSCITKLNIKGLYSLYCSNREPPSDLIISQSSCLGMAIATDMQTGLPSYLSLFCWPWGQWIYHVDGRHASRALIQDLFTKIAEANIPVVHGDQDMPRLLSLILGTLSRDSCLPRFINVVGNSTIADAAWTQLGVDTISWRVYVNVCRLSEREPKNPINASFMQSWRLRWEQMAMLGCDALTCICLFEQFVQRSIIYVE